MTKKLGISLTATSVAWSVTEKNDNGIFDLVKSGVHTFPEGVSHTQEGEVPSSRIRTEKRLIRKNIRRTRGRKIDLVKILSGYGFCPKVLDEELLIWKSKKKFPLSNTEFVNWLTVDEKNGNNPYTDRHECLTRILDFSKQKECYIFGRALYHLNQRRGFLSNKKEKSKGDDQLGAMKQGIVDLTAAMLESGCEYLGEYLYKVYGTERIRGRYIGRKEHIEAEFNAICDKQNIDKGLRKKLSEVIFRLPTRPVKNMNLIGKCPLEPDKYRCAISHPAFEKYRLYSQINNIKVCDSGGGKLRPLTEEEVLKIMPLFFRKSSKNFDFSEIAVKLTGQKAPKKLPKKARKEGVKADNGKVFGGWRFNYSLDQTFAGCPTSAHIISALGGEADCYNWEDVLYQRYKKGEGKDVEDVVNDLWNYLDWCDGLEGSEEKLSGWLMENFGITKDLADYSLEEGYASFSLNAIRKITPYLLEGYVLYDSMLLANLPAAVPGKADAAAATVKDAIDTYRMLKTKDETLYDYVVRTLEETYSEFVADKLYNPAAIDRFVASVDKESGKTVLPSPFSSSLKNPLVMRCLHQLKAVVNKLILEGLIDEKTEVVFMTNEEINTGNERKAIREIIKNNEKENAAIRTEIEKLGRTPSEDDILKYWLWKEQNQIDLYTGRNISVTDLFSPVCRLSHIVPLSLGGGDMKVNLVVSSEDKRDEMPVVAFGKDTISAAMDNAGFDERIEKLQRWVFAIDKRVKSAQSMDEKNRQIIQRHRAQKELSYLTEKKDRLLSVDGYRFNDTDSAMKTQTDVIIKYACSFLQSVFPSTNTVKTGCVPEFRRLWGLTPTPSYYGEEILNAITVSCIDRSQILAWQKYRQNLEYNRLYGRPLSPMPLPWEGFAKDATNASLRCMSSSLHKNNLVKQDKRKLRDKDGKILRDSEGNIMYQKSDTARGSLHKDTFYGERKSPDGSTVYFETVSINKIASMDESDQLHIVEKVLDPLLRQKMLEAVHCYGSFNDAYQAGAFSSGKFPIRRIKVKSFIKNPIRLKTHVESDRAYLVFNDQNYCMIITESGYRIVSNLDAVKAWKDGECLEKGTIIRKGQGVLFYEKDMNELKSLSAEELSTRFYRVAGLGVQMKFRHHLDKGSCFANGGWVPGICTPAFIMRYDKYGFALEGKDFRVTKTCQMIWFSHTT